MVDLLVDLLSEMIKPAFPTEQTVDLIVGNAKNWGYSTYLILEQHYQATLELWLEELSGMPTQDWRRAFEVAARWVRRDLPRIPQDVIDHAEAVITARLAPTGPVQQEPAPRPAMVDCSVQAQDPPQVRSVSFQTQTVSVPVPVRKQNPSVATMMEEAQITDWSPVQEPEGPPRALEEAPLVQEDCPLEQRRRGGRRTVGTIHNKPPFSWQFSSESEEEEEVRVIPRVINYSIYLEAQDSTTTPSPQIPRPVVAQVHQRAPETLPEEPTEEERVNTPSPQTTQQMVAQASQALTASLPLFSPDSSSEGEELQALEKAFQQSFSTSSPQSPRFRVRRHNNTQRKLTDWNLPVEKKWILMGDSNLSKFPGFLNQDLQVESYPGSHFRHAHALIEKCDPPEDLMVEKVVLAFGINTRTNKLKETTMKTVQGAVRSAKRKFPLAEIWNPQVNFSANLPAEEKENLEDLNAYLQRNASYIPLFPEAQFHTEEDDVHWTSETADAMFQHWMDFLNILNSSAL